MSTDNKDVVRVAFEHVERESELSMADGTYDNPCVQSAWEGYRAGHAAQIEELTAALAIRTVEYEAADADRLDFAERITALTTTLRGRQEEIGRLVCRVGELEAASASAEPVAEVRDGGLSGPAIVPPVQWGKLPDGTQLYTRPATQAASPSLTNEKIAELYRESFNAMVGRLREAPKTVPDTVLTFALAIESHLKGGLSYDHQ